MSKKAPAQKVVRDIRRKTRRKHSTEEKTRIALDGLCGEESIANSYFWTDDLFQASRTGPMMDNPKSRREPRRLFVLQILGVLRGCANEKRPRQLPDRTASPKNSVIPLARSLGTFGRPRISVHLAVHLNPEAWHDSIV